MTYYRPCFNCTTDKVACPTREKVKSAIKGLRLTSINFTCPDRAQRFRRGQRVSFNWRYYDDDGSGENYVSFNGTIMHEKKGNKRFVIRVDQEGEHYDLLPKDVLKSCEFVSVRHDDIAEIDEPDRSLCGLCAAYDDLADMERLCWTIGCCGDRRCMRDGTER